MNNRYFKPRDLTGLKKQAGLNRLTLTPEQWIESTNAVDPISKRGATVTCAQTDITFEFAMWISVEFKLYLIKENLIPYTLTKLPVNAVYATETDLFNIALFGVIAQQ